DVVIDIGDPTRTITHATGIDSVRSLTCRENFVLSGGTLALGEASVIEGTFSLLGGTLADTGTLTAAGSLFWTAGTMRGPGRTVANADLVISGPGSKLLDGRTLENVNAAFWLDGGLSATNGAVVDNLAGARFDILTDGTFALGSTSGSLP